MEYPPILRSNDGVRQSAEAEEPRRSVSEASDASDEQPEAIRINTGGSRHRERGGRMSEDLDHKEEEDGEADLDLLDEEERIALMQVDREQHKKRRRRSTEAASTETLPFGLSNLSGVKAGGKSRGCIVFLLACIVILAIVPLFQWLSYTSGFSSNSAHQVVSAGQEALDEYSGGFFPYQQPKSESKKLDPDTTEITLPFYDKDRAGLVTGSKGTGVKGSAKGSKKQPIAKFQASSNDAAGNYGLKRASDAISRVDRAFEGWATPEESLEHFESWAAQKSKQIGVTSIEAMKAEAERDADLIARLKSMVAHKKMGGTTSKLKQLNMDMLFNGTFYAARENIDWSDEDVDVGVFSFRDPATGDIVIQDVTHLKKEKTGMGEVAKGGGKVILAHGNDLRDVSRIELSFFLQSNLPSLLSITVTTSPSTDTSSRRTWATSCCSPTN